MCDAPWSPAPPDLYIEIPPNPAYFTPVLPYLPVIPLPTQLPTPVAPQQTLQSPFRGPHPQRPSGQICALASALAAVVYFAVSGFQQGAALQGAVCCMAAIMIFTVALKVVCTNKAVCG
jgi:hypothetical protein